MLRLTRSNVGRNNNGAFWVMGHAIAPNSLLFVVGMEASIPPLVIKHDTYLFWLTSSAKVLGTMGLEVPGHLTEGGKGACSIQRRGTSPHVLVVAVVCCLAAASCMRSLVSRGHLICTKCTSSEAAISARAIACRTAIAVARTCMFTDSQIIMHFCMHRCMRLHRHSRTCPHAYTHMSMRLQMQQKAKARALAHTHPCIHACTSSGVGATGCLFASTLVRLTLYAIALGKEKGCTCTRRGSREGVW